MTSDVVEQKKTTGAINLSRRLVMVNSASAVLNRLLSVTVLIWLFQYLIQRIPVEEFALYPLVMAVMVVAPLFFSAFNGGLARFLIDAYAREDYQRARALLSSVVPALALCVMAFWIVGAVFTLSIETFLNIPRGLEHEAQLMMGLLVFSFGVQMFLAPFMVGFHIRQRYVEQNLLELLRELLRFAILLILMLTLGPKVIWVVVATSVAEIVIALAMALRSRQLVPDLRFDRRLGNVRMALHLTSFGLWTTLGQLGGLMYTNAATIVLNLHGTATDVTCYFLGATIFRQTEAIIMRAIAPLLPVITALNVSGDNARLTPTVLRGGRYALWAAMIVATPAIIYADIFVKLYVGPGFMKAAWVIILFMSMLPFTQAVALLPLTALAKGWMRQFYLPAFIAQLLGLVLMLVAVTRFEMGAIGVTAALAIVTIGSQLLYFWHLCRRMIDVDFGTFYRRVLLPGLLPAAAGAVVWTGVRFAVPMGSWVALFGCGALGAIVYFATLLAFSLEPEARRKLADRISRLRARISQFLSGSPGS
ncbi:MAG: hypothetical protein WBB25_16310 [Sulfitobacter sp.]